MMVVTDMHTIIEELLEAVFSEWSVLRLYNEDQLPLPVSRESLQAACLTASVTEAWDGSGTKRKGNILPLEATTRQCSGDHNW
jgi:hypothetical protein